MENLPDISGDNETFVVEFLLDQTGSMGQHKSQTIAGYNIFITEQRDDGLGQCLVTLTKFSTRENLTPYINLDVNMVPMMTEDTFIPNGGTNLRDNIANRITNLRNRLQKWDVMPKVIFVVMTDGEDTSSMISETETREMIQDASAQGWNFHYLGAYNGASDTAIRLGFSEKNIKTFSGAKITDAMRSFSNITKAYRSSTISESGLVSAVQ